MFSEQTLDSVLSDQPEQMSLYLVDLDVVQTPQELSPGIFRTHTTAWTGPVVVISARFLYAAGYVQ